jgi:hypothetical protein
VKFRLERWKYVMNAFGPMHAKRECVGECTC